MFEIVHRKVGTVGAVQRYEQTHTNYFPLKYFTKSNLSIYKHVSGYGFIQYDRPTAAILCTDDNTPILVMFLKKQEKYSTPLYNRRL